MNDVKIHLLKHQKEFLQSTKQHTVIVGGFRSGKTFAGIQKCINKLFEGYKYKSEPLDIAYYLPTYDLIKKIAYPEFIKNFQDLGIPFNLNQQEHTIKTDYGKIYFVSMDNPFSIMGYSVHYSLIDEIDRVHKNKVDVAFNNILARNSALTNQEYNCTDFVSTPEGFGFLYNFWNKNKKNPKVKLIQANTRNNPYIHSNYIKSLEDKYDSNLLRAYLNGEFVNLASGTVYHAFNREQHHTDLTINPKETLFIGMDFNIEKMAAVVFVIRQGITYALKEYCNVYDTFQMIDLIQQDFEKHPKIVFPDASGKNRSSSGASDHQALKRARFQVLAPSTNPPIRDRVNTMNLAFQKERLFVNTTLCPIFTEALEQQAYDKNGQPDKSTGHDHVNDAGGYGVHSIFVRKKYVRL